MSNIIEKKKNQLKDLDLELKELNEKRQNLLDKMGAIADEIQVPELKARFEGKYFVSTGSYDGKETWKVYVYVRECTDRELIKVDKFETEINGISSFKVNEVERYFVCETEITKDEYNKEKQLFINKLNELK